MIFPTRDKEGSALDARITVHHAYATYGRDSLSANLYISSFTNKNLKTYLRNEMDDCAQSTSTIIPVRCLEIMSCGWAERQVLEAGDRAKSWLGSG